MVSEVKGLMAITRDAGIKALSITYNSKLFVIQSIGNVIHVSITGPNTFHEITQNLDMYVRLLKSFIGIINYVANQTKSRYYTFLGNYKYNFNKHLFIYEPYVELLKSVVIEITTKSVRVKFNGENVRKIRSRKGVKPSKLIEIIDQVFKQLVET